MAGEKKFGLDDAYAVETPEDNIRLYADWADSYESDFVLNHGWVAFRRVAEELAKHRDGVRGAVLDVGCGTGIGGVALRECGFDVLDGIDISAEMLAAARQKTFGEETPVYRSLYEADLTQTLEIDSDSYGGLVSAGTFTHGHLGPEALDELWRIAANGAICVISINASHYGEMGFAAKIEADTATGTIAVLDLDDFDVYTHPQPDVPPGNERAKLLVCRIAG